MLSLVDSLNGGVAQTSDAAAAAAEQRIVAEQQRIKEVQTGKACAQVKEVRSNRRPVRLQCNC